MVHNYISLKHVLERLDRIKLPAQYYNIEEVKEWAYDALNEIGVKESTIEAEKKLEVIDGKVSLPDNFEKFIALYYDSNEGTENRNYIYYYPMLELGPTEEFKMMSFKIHNGYIYTDFDEGYVLLHYMSFPIDDYGWPLIPDNPFFIGAVEHYLRYMIGQRLYWARKIVINELNMLRGEWIRYAGKSKVSQKQISSDRVKRVLMRNFPALDKSRLRRKV